MNNMRNVAVAVEEQTATTAEISRSVNSANTGTVEIAKNINGVASRGPGFDGQCVQQPRPWRKSSASMWESSTQAARGASRQWRCIWTGIERTAGERNLRRAYALAVGTGICS